MTRTHRKSTCVYLSLCAGIPLTALADGVGEALVDEADIQLKSRLAIVNREFEDTPADDREQSALGLILAYESGKIGDLVSLGVAAYHAEKLWTSGLAADDMLPLESSGKQDQRFSKIGEAYLRLEPSAGAAVTLGLQQTESLLLSSSWQRALPNTFQGASLALHAWSFAFYSNWFNRWTKRHDDSWIDFTTDLGHEINYLWVNGLHFRADRFSANLEHLIARDFLAKTGLVVSYFWLPDQAQKITARGGYFISRDDGDLFRVGSESDELDDEDGAVFGVSSENDGEGAFAQLSWHVSDWTLSVAASRFDEAWIEDNFSGDHGTNPFPTRSIIYPDFTNTGETAVMATIAYDWRDLVPGLSTAFTYVKGYDIENSVSPAFGRAEERYREFFVQYAPEWPKGLSLQWRHHDYDSRKCGEVDGVKPADLDDRIFIDYTIRF